MVDVEPVLQGTELIRGEKLRDHMEDAGTCPDCGGGRFNVTQPEDDGSLDLTCSNPTCGLSLHLSTLDGEIVDVERVERTWH